MLSPNATILVAESCGTAWTVTENVQLSAWLWASEAVQLTCERPIGNTVPLFGEQLTDTGAVPP
jgi:hypothetical protein